MPKYRNLEAEMKRINIKRRDLANILHIRYATVSDKLNGKSSFTFDETFIIKKEFFPKLSLEYLFICDELMLTWEERDYGRLFIYCSRSSKDT